MLSDRNGLRNALCASRLRHQLSASQHRAWQRRTSFTYSAQSWLRCSGVFKHENQLSLTKITLQLLVSTRLNRRSRKWLQPTRASSTATAIEEYFRSHAPANKAGQSTALQKRLAPLDLFEPRGEEARTPKLPSVRRSRTSETYEEAEELENVEDDEASGVSSTWTKTIDEIMVGIDRRRASVQEKHLNFTQAEDWGQWFSAGKGEHYLIWRKKWLCVDPDFRSREWESLMLWYLQHDHDAALKFLQATLIGPLPSMSHIADVLKVTTSKAALLEDRSARAAQLKKILRVALYSIRRCPDNFPLPQRTIWTLVREASSDATYEMHMTLEACGTRVRSQTLLRMSHNFARIPEQSERALETMTAAITKSSEESPPLILQKICATLLRSAAKYSSGHTLGIVKQLNNVGIEFDMVMYNTLIANASDRGEYKTAWQLFEHVNTSGMRPDPGTYVVLFKMCRRSNDFLAFRALYDEVRGVRQDDEVPDLDSMLVTELLYSFWVFSSNTFNRTLKLYQAYFDLQPLATLGMIKVTEPSELSRIQATAPNTISKDGRAFEGPRPPPTPLAVAIMIFIFLRSHQDSAEWVTHIYETFKARIAVKDPLITPAAECELTWDSFLKALAGNKKTLHMWPDVLRTMADPSRVIEQAFAPQKTPTDLIASDPYRPSVPLFEDEDPADASALNSHGLFKPVKPTVLTWSILLHSFVKQNQLSAAEKVLDLLDRHGIKPMAATWNSLISGWTRTGQREKVLSGLENMEKRGLKWDRYTAKAVRGDTSNYGSGRIGMGDRTKGGGLRTGQRLPTGAFEYAGEEVGRVSGR